jgi:hypothetical protein
VTIRRSTGEVLAFLADAPEYGDHGSGSRVPVFKEVPPGPTRFGTRWHAVIQFAPGVRIRDLLEAGVDVRPAGSWPDAIEDGSARTRTA